MKLGKSKTAITRGNIFAEYVSNMTSYLRMRYPTAPKKSIEQFVRTLVEKRVVEMQTKYKQFKKDGEEITSQLIEEEKLWPMVTVVDQSDPNDPLHKFSYGNFAYRDEIPLFDYINEHRDKVITPFGSIYTTTDKKPSFLKGMIDEKAAKRKKEKKAMLKAKKDGNVALAISHNNNQYTIKVSMNSLSGGMGSGYNFLSSIPNYNSITSISRFFIMNTYAHAERYLEGNFYFRTEDQILDWMVQCQHHGPDENAIRSVISQYQLKIPTVDEVLDFIVESYEQYSGTKDIPRVKAIVESMSDMSRCFLFYMSNAKNLFFHNDNIFRNFVTSVFADTYDKSILEECTPADIYTLDSDLVIVLSVVHNDKLPKNNKGNSLSIYDIVDTDPELTKEFYARGKHMQSCIDRMNAIFEVFMHHNVRIGYVLEHKNMFRKTVILSDTDSIIFTVKTWLKWWNGSYRICQSAYNISALMVYYLCKANVTLNYNISRVLGAVDKDLFAMSAKNEFTMPIEVLTSLKKHYMCLWKIQEGVIYGEPLLDIKGVNLRGSTYSAFTLSYSNWFIEHILRTIYEKGKVSAQEVIQHVLRFERIVYDSLKAGETKFLTISPIKLDTEYKVKEASIYFNYLAWEAIFGKKYGHIAIPTKCFIVPLQGINSAGYEYYLQENHPDIFEGLHKFQEKYPGKALNLMPINPLTDEIPIELRKIINYKQIIRFNARPLYIVLRCLAINLGMKDKSLYSEMYGWATSEEARTAIEHIYYKG